MKKIIILLVFVFCLFFNVVNGSTSIYSTDFNYNASLSSHGWSLYTTTGNYPDRTSYYPILNQFVGGRNTTDSGGGATSTVWIYRNLGSSVNEGYLNVNGHVILTRDTEISTLSRRMFLSLRYPGEFYTSENFGLYFYKEKIAINIGSEICEVNVSFPYDIEFEWNLDYTLLKTSLYIIQNGSLIGYCNNISYLSNKNVSAITIGIREYAHDNYERYITDLEITANSPTKFGSNIKCDSDSDCISNYCLRGSCSLKTYGMECSESYECLSESCINNYCSKSSLSQNLQATKSQLWGDDTATGNIVSLIIIIFVSAILSISNIVLGIFVALPVAILLTIMGWLSPFILVGILFLLLGGLVLLLFLGKGGN